MREYKFRGKIVDNGSWVKGSLLIENGIPFIVIDLFDKGIPNYFQVIPETVGQYTGLKDKNGKEICEGDILLSDFFTWEGKCIVKFGEYYNEEQWENNRSGYGWYTEMLNGEPSSRRELSNDVLEVVGNIHDEVIK